jgi:hypothetical protein
VTRTFIYGSCVARDTFEYLRPHGFELVEYVARQSVISAFSQIDTSKMPEIDTSSPFQRRMIEGDWGGSLLERLQHHREAIDLVLWDLCDERLGVWRLGDGAFVTRSVDGITSGLDAAVARSAEHVAFGTKDHLALFRDRVGRFSRELDDLGLRERTLVLAPDWASERDDGEPTPTSYGLKAVDANRMYLDYFQAIREIVGVPVLRFTGSEVQGASDHQWGPAPFHYAESVYRKMTESVLYHLGRLGVPQG